MRPVWNAVAVALAVALLVAFSPRTRAEDTPADPGPAAGTGRITGTVTDKDGNPVEKARVRLVKAPKKPAPANGRGGVVADPAEGQPDQPGDGEKPLPPKPPTRPSNLLPQALTDVDGKYVLDNIPPGQYLVTAFSPKGMAKIEATVKADEIQTVDLKLEPRQPVQHPARPGRGAPGGPGRPGVGGM